MTKLVLNPTDVTDLAYGGRGRMVDPATDGRCKGSEADRFWGKVQGGDVTECWIWTAKLTKKGYGDFWVGARRRVAAHRWSYEHLIGEIPDGLQLDHLCRNRACVNPWHLDPVTGLVNTRRGQGGALKTHCPSGHAYDEANTKWYDGRRYCRACHTAHSYAYVVRRRARQGDLARTKDN